MKKNEKHLLKSIRFIVAFTERVITQCDLFNINEIKIKKFMLKLQVIDEYWENNFNKIDIRYINEKEDKLLYDLIYKFIAFANKFENKKMFIEEFLTIITDVIDGKLKTLWCLYNTFNEDTLYRIML